MLSQPMARSQEAPGILPGSSRSSPPPPPRYTHDVPAYAADSDPANASRYGAPGPCPFVIDGPVRANHQLFGRDTQISQLYDFIRGHRAIQIIGEARMGLTSMLRWAEREEITRRAVLYLDAERLPAPTPTALMEGLLDQLDLTARFADALERLRSGDTEVMPQILNKLERALILIDNAHALTVPGNGFDSAFFRAWRAPNESGRLIWVSASHHCLYQRFRSQKITSGFLYDTMKVHIGALDAQSARVMLERNCMGLEGRSFGINPSLVPRVLDLAGYFPYGLQWMGHELWHHSPSTTELAERFQARFDGLFAQWLEQRDAIERALLARCASDPLDVRIMRSNGNLRQKKAIRRLERLGLLSERAGHWALPGSVWRGHVLQHTRRQDEACA